MLVGFQSYQSNCPQRSVMHLFIFFISVYYSILSSMPHHRPKDTILKFLKYQKHIERFLKECIFFYYRLFPCHKIKNYFDFTLKDKAHFICNYYILPLCIYFSISNLSQPVNLFSVNVISLFSLSYTNKSDLFS